MCGSSCLAFLAIGIGLGTLHFDFLTDYRFYVSQLLLIGLIVVQIEGRKQCEDNIPLFNFSSFLIISAAPLASALILWLMPFKNTVEGAYDSPFSMFAMCGITLLLTIIYYLNKLRSGAISHWHWLFLNILIGTFSIVLHAKLIQEFDAYSYLIASNGINIVVFLLLAIRNKEMSSAKALMCHRHKLAVVVLLYCLTQLLNTRIVTQLPVEQYVTLRSAGMVLVGYAYHYVQDRRVLFTLRDVVLLLCIISTQLYFT